MSYAGPSTVTGRLGSFCSPGVQLHSVGRQPTPVPAGSRGCGCGHWRSVSVTRRLPTVSLEALLAGTAGIIAGHTDVRLADYITEIMASGFPGLRGLPDRLLRGELDSYLRNAVDRDIPEQGLAVRKPAVLLDWLRAYAAATASTASYAEILDAVTAGISDKPARSTTVAYRDALQQLWLLDPLPAWLPVGREFARLGQTPTHHLADPALAARLLGLTYSALLDGAGTTLGRQHGSMLGRLFESLAALSVRSSPSGPRRPSHTCEPATATMRST